MNIPHRLPKDSTELAALKKEVNHELAGCDRCCPLRKLYAKVSRRIRAKRRDAVVRPHLARFEECIRSGRDFYLDDQMVPRFVVHRIIARAKELGWSHCDNFDGRDYSLKFFKPITKEGDTP